MMTDRRITLSLATAFALIAFAMASANADEGPAAAKPADAAANVRTAANLDVPAPRSSIAPARVVRLHHRKLATTARRSVSGAAGLVRIDYRPAIETACASGICRPPIVLFIGITY
jgi:hypothetical protein